MWRLHKFFAVLVSVLCAVHGAKILGIVHLPVYSHFQLGDVIFRELAAKGHEVTVISPFDLKGPVENLKHVVLTGLKEELEAMKPEMLRSSESSAAARIIQADVMCLKLTEYVLEHKNVQNLLKSDEKFDLVIYENFPNEAFSGFAYHYNTPYLILSTIGASRWTNPKMGNSNNPSYVPDIFLSYTSKMSFTERMHNTVTYLGSQLLAHIYTLPKQNQLLHKYFPGAPHLNDLMYNASLMLLNSHPSIGAPLPLLPNMIEIGGYHVKASKSLHKDLKDYLDSAKDGAIFFSMGSRLKSSYMTEEKRDALVRSLGKLKQKVLWKWEDDVLPGKPSNVKLEKWLPQQDILAHPNIKLFITHGGLLSTIEAIYHGVPVLGIPVVGDQELNVAYAEAAGYAIGVPYKDLTEAALTSALSEMLSNPRYAENVKQRSKIFHDREVKPLDRAIYWIEYVIRHRGAPHLKTAALDLCWYQIMLLDVAGAWLLGTILVVWILSKVAKLLCRKWCKKRVAGGKKKN